jgi:hypothetical protein
VPKVRWINLILKFVLANPNPDQSEPKRTN